MLSSMQTDELPDIHSRLHGSGYSVFEASEARKGQQNSCLSTKISASPGEKTLYTDLEGLIIYTRCARKINPQRRTQFMLAVNA